MPGTETQTDVAKAAGETTTAAVTSEVKAEPKPSQNGQQTPPSEKTAEPKPTLLDQKKEADAGKTQVAPEKYEFKAPQGAELGEGVLNAYSEAAKKLNLSQEAAQSVLDSVIPAMQKHGQDRVEAIRNEWAEASKADKDFGGEHLQANLGIAKKALDRFGTSELRSLLSETGLGNHPEVIRLLLRAGKAISEDKVVPSRTETTGRTEQMNPDVLADRLYSGTEKK